MHDVATIQTYNGWANRETWLMSLWLNNHEYGERLLSDVQHAFDSDIERAEELERLMRDEYEDDLNRSSLGADLLSTALSRVNWLQVVTDL